jgi:hypothetical protein
VSVPDHRIALAQPRTDANGPVITSSPVLRPLEHFEVLFSRDADLHRHEQPACPLIDEHALDLLALLARLELRRAGRRAGRLPRLPGSGVGVTISPFSSTISSRHVIA